MTLYVRLQTTKEYYYGPAIEVDFEIIQSPDVFRILWDGKTGRRSYHPWANVVSLELQEVEDDE